MSSYRFYSLDQLPRLNRILALKDLGLSLDQISFNRSSTNRTTTRAVNPSPFKTGRESKKRAHRGQFACQWSRP